MTEPGRYTAADYEQLREIVAEVDAIRQQEHERVPLSTPIRTRIEPTSSGYGVIRFTEEQRRAIKAERARRLIEHERRFRETYSGSQGTKGLKGHTFTRRTYRAARKRTIRAMLAERERFVRENHRWPLFDTDGFYWPLRRVAAEIVNRGRREKGMWRA